MMFIRFLTPKKIRAFGDAGKQVALKPNLAKNKGLVIILQGLSGAF